MHLVAFHHHFRLSAPGWSSFRCSDCAEYLGILLGPGACGKEWHIVVRKASDTTIRWKHIACGFFFNVIACNVFILSLFSYLGQFLNFEPCVDTFENWMARQLFGGPGSWLPKDMKFNLKAIGLPVELRSLADSLTAAKVRVCHRSQLDLEELTSELGIGVIRFLGVSVGSMSITSGTRMLCFSTS